ncbi:MAG: RNA methyltransferase [Nitrososphaerales archaeon]
MDFWLAIPDSALADEQTKRDKSVKIAQFARAFAIFRVKRVYIYRDKERDYSSDRKLLKIILEFLDTPQYLRRSLYPKREELQFAGLLHPLKAPHHKPAVDPSNLKVGEYRQGVATKIKGQYYVDAGLRSLIPLEGPAPIGKRITVKFISKYPVLKCRVIEDGINEYWGYHVKEVSSLTDLLSTLKGLIILTSKTGKPLSFFEKELVADLKSTPNTLVVFGSPNRGLVDLLMDERKQPKDFSKYIVNFFPEQGTETVRLEEAIMGCMSLLNYLVNR